MVLPVNVLRTVLISWITSLLVGCLRKETWKPIPESDDLSPLVYVEQDPSACMPVKTLDIDYNPRLTGTILSYTFYKGKLYLLSRTKIIRISITEHGGVSLISKLNQQGLKKIKPSRDSLIFFGDTTALISDVNLNFNAENKIVVKDRIVDVIYTQGRILLVSASGVITAYTEDLQTELWKTMPYNQYSIGRLFVHPIKNHVFFLKNSDKLLSIDMDSGSLTTAENIWADSELDICVAGGPKVLYVSNGKSLLIKTDAQVLNYLVPQILNIHTKRRTVILETNEEFLVSNNKELEKGIFFGRMPKTTTNHTLIISPKYLYLGDPKGVSVFSYSGQLLSRLVLKRPLLLDLGDSVGIITQNRFSVYT